MAEMRAKSDAALQQSDEKLSKILDAKQLDRLNQLRLQREGVQALHRDDIAKTLKLTEAQRQKLRDQPPSFPFAPPDVLQQAKSEALAVLTKEQQEKWTELRGKEFAFPESGPGGFGPGGHQQI